MEEGNVFVPTELKARFLRVLIVDWIHEALQDITPKLVTHAWQKALGTLFLFLGGCTLGGFEMHGCNMTLQC